MKKQLFALVIAIGIFAVACNSKGVKSVELKNEVDSFSYALGLNIGQSLKNEEVAEINYDAFIMALNQGIKEDSTAALSADSAIMIIQAYIGKIKEKKFEGNKLAGDKFLEENKKKEGVVTLPSGLQYKVIKEGNGAKPMAEDQVSCHYRGTLIDGREFDSSIGREPAKFPVTGVIAGWQEALPLMTLGSKWELYIPSELAYGKSQIPQSIIEPNSVLIFEIELLEIIKPEETKKDSK